MGKSYQVVQGPVELHESFEMEPAMAAWKGLNTLLLVLMEERMPVMQA